MRGGDLRMRLRWTTMREPGPSLRQRGCAVALVLAIAAGLMLAQPAPAGAALPAFEVDGDRIDAPLGGAQGDAARGRALVLARDTANCLLCHAIPDRDVRFFGDVGPPLGGVGARLTAAQIRLRLVDNARRDP